MALIPDTEKSFNRSSLPLIDVLKGFFKLQAAGGIILVLASAFAIMLANSPFAALYDHILHGLNFTLGFTDAHSGMVYGLSKSVLHWINDGLMAIFFFLVGLEIKREFTSGELSSRDRAILPFIAALGGMIVPAVIYFFFNMQTPETHAGWAIPSATDIAFTLGVMSLLGSRIPFALKVFVTAVAVIDDLGAIVIIAVFYASNIKAIALMIAALGLGILVILNKRGVTKLSPYILIGLIVWAAVLKSGVHATIAGVLVAFCIPSSCKKDPHYKPGEFLEHAIHPWVAFAILPLFGFANAGVPFAGMSLHNLLDPVVLGIACGLFFGKQIGILAFVTGAVKLGISSKPPGCTWLQMYGAAILCGIGFTMSLFIGTLAFTDITLQAEVRLGVLIGSILSACYGAFILSYAAKKAPKADLHFIKA